MTELEAIQDAVRRAAQRRRLFFAWKALWKGVFVSSMVALATLSAFKLTPIPPDVLLGLLLTAVALPVIFGIIAWFKSPGMLETAQWLDHEAGLKERLSTALEFERGAHQDEWRQLILKDASRHATEVNPGRLLPISLPKVARWSLVTLLVGASLGFVPEYRSDQFLQEQKQQAAIEDTGKNLSRLAKRSLEQRDPMLPATEQSLSSVEELGKVFQKQRLSRAQALQDLAKLSDKIEDQAADLRKDPAVQRIQQAARDAGTQGETADGLQKQMEDLQRQIDNKDLAADDIKDLKKQLQKLQENAASMGGSKGSKSNASKLSQMADNLSSLMDEAEAMGINPEDLKSALEALKNADIDKFLKDMDKALSNVEDMEKLAEKLGEMRRAMEQVGKDLKEQLERGQASTAISTLKEMQKKLQSGQMSEKEMQEMLNELSKAMDPADSYGECKSHLQKASNNMQGGNKQQAAQNLADAAKELQELMEKAGDLASLQEMMKALQASKMSVGNCQGWGQCYGPGGKSGQGKKPGKGVGTWADDSLTGFFPNSGLWDNTGIEAQNLDPKGLSDRGEGTVRDDLTTTKVKGQFNPGASMPSITLKNVSIKGTSRIEYEEAVAAAQSDAQSALSQEKVPRPYQGAVKDYFDDLK